MIRKSLFLGLLILLLFSASTRALEIEWQKKYVKKYHDSGNWVQQKKDGGYIIAGTKWYLGGIFSRVFLIKTDEAGRELWLKTFGIGNVNWGLCLDMTEDGGFIVVGTTWAKAEKRSDIYLLRTDAEGNAIWSRTFGGKNREQGHSVKQTSDGGFIIAGQTDSFGAGKDDVYLIKTDEKGNELWNKTYGGPRADHAYSVQQTRKGGYIIAGKTNSFDLGGGDVYLIKTDAEGNMIWSKTYGSKKREWGKSVQQTRDDGYIIVGNGWHSGSRYSDVYVIKTDAHGKELWQARGV